MGSPPNGRPRTGPAPVHGCRRPGSPPARRQCGPPQAAPGRLQRPRTSSGRRTPPRANRPGQHGLLARDPVQPPQLGKVRGTNEGDDGEVGLDHRGQRPHLARGADPRLHHREAMAGRVEPGKRESDADLVVQVALGREHAPGLPPKEQRKDLLGRRLARAAGDPDDRPAEALPVLAGHAWSAARGSATTSWARANSGVPLETTARPPRRSGRAPENHGRRGCLSSAPRTPGPSTAGASRPRTRSAPPRGGASIASGP